MSGKIDNVCFICPDSLAAGEDRVTTENLDNVNTDINSPVTPIYLLLLDKKKKGLALIIRLLELGIYVIEEIISIKKHFNPFLFVQNEDDIVGSLFI